MSSLHTVARDGLVSAWSDPSVAAVAGIDSVTWATRVLKGDRAGLLAELHRGRLPAVEIFQVDDHWKALGDIQLGVVTSRWGIRVHVATMTQTAGEELARNIVYAGLIIARNQNYFFIGDETITNFGDSPLGYTIEVQFNLQSAMDRKTYETDFSTPGGGTPPSGGSVGGIRTELQYNAAYPFAVLALPAGQALDEVEVIMEIPFNDPTATIEVGIPSSHGAYMTAGDVDVTSTDSFEREASAVGPLTVFVYCNPGTSTAGKFVVQIVTTGAT
jgi:hypothetical protein